MSTGNLVVLIAPIIIVLAIFLVPRSIFRYYDSRVARRADSTHELKAALYDQSPVRIDELLQKLEKGNHDGIHNDDGKEVSRSHEMAGHS